MSKVDALRPRHVAFHVECVHELPRRVVAQAIQDAARMARLVGGAPPRLTRYEFPHGTVRVEHTDAAAVRALLEGIRAAGGQAARFTPMATSGTLAALARRLGVLGRRQA